MNTWSALERATREKALQRQTDEMRFFNSILRHDVYNGMTVIRARAELLGDELEGDQQGYAKTIESWSNDIIAIVQRVRTVLDALTSDDTPMLHEVNLSATLRTEIGRVQTTYPAVRFETEIPDGVMVLANELLGEVFGNIITNAINHNEREGLVISVTVEQKDGMITTKISDNGRGIPDADKESIFRRDYTGHVKSTGSGFGLFFVDTMASTYDGAVWVEDASPTGATFTIELMHPSTRARIHSL